MRDLTEEELNLAPDWAVKFDFFNGELIYMSDVVGNYEGKPLYRFLYAKHNIEEVGVEGDYDLCTRLIPSKPFDITKHEFSDAAKDCHILFNNPSWAGNDLQIEIPDVNGNHADSVLIKEHAIAIAKHFKLTWEDLK